LSACDFHLQASATWRTDENFMRFFCFLALFASGMLGVVIANNLFLFSFVGKSSA